VATAAAMNVDRIVAWLDERPRAKTRISRFAALAPTCFIPPETPSVEDDHTLAPSCDLAPYKPRIPILHHKNIFSSAVP
jgi:hypothetical protein